MQAALRSVAVCAGASEPVLFRRGPVRVKRQLVCVVDADRFTVLVDHGEIKRRVSNAIPGFVLLEQADEIEQPFRELLDRNRRVILAPDLHLERGPVILRGGGIALAWFLLFHSFILRHRARADKLQRRCHGSAGGLPVCVNL